LIACRRIGRQASHRQADRPVGKHERHATPTSGRSFHGGSAMDRAPRENQRRVSPPSPFSHSRRRVAVLSFTPSVSEQSENLAFALGQEITAALGRLRRFDVIAGTSLNCAVPTCVVSGQQVRGIGLDYLVDVTVSDVEQDAKINVRLLDVRGSARPIWSKRLDVTNCSIRRMGELVAKHVLGHVDPGVPLGDGDLKLPERHGATGFLRRAVPLMASMERKKFQQAGQLIKAALEIDPDDAEIAAWAARWQHLNIAMGYGPHSQQEFVKARDLALRAMKLNPNNAEALGLYAHYCAFVEKEFDTALHYFDRSLRINPSLAFIWGLSGPTYCYIGEPRTALQRLDHYRELAPFDPYMSCFKSLYAMAYLFNEDYERAAIVGRSGVQAFPDFVNGYKPLVAALGHLGRREEAKPYLDKLLTLEPGFTVEKFAEVYPIKKAADRKRYTEGLRLAGVPVIQPR
jgi:tetratricopeptide (TPR) repeat protein